VSKVVIPYLLDNLKKTNFLDKSVIVKKNVKNAIIFLEKRGERFDIVFASPPYKYGCGKLLEVMGERHIMKPSSFFIIEHQKKEILPEEFNGFTLHRECRYGATIVDFYISMKP